MLNAIQWHDHTLNRQDRADQKGQRPCVLWFTGLSGAGKSTLANLVEQRLFELGYHSFLLDGDNVRHGLNKDLGFSDNDRVENIRRIGEVAKLMTDSGLIVLSAFISPFQKDRDLVRALFADREFLEVYVDAPLHICEQRDPKGLYRKARSGEIRHFTGIDSDYQPPVAPDIHVRTADHSATQCAERVIQQLSLRGYLKRATDSRIID